MFPVQKIFIRITGVSSVANIQSQSSAYAKKFVPHVWVRIGSWKFGAIAILW